MNGILKAVLGHIRAPKYAQLTLAVHEGKLRVAFVAQQSGPEERVQFEREYPTDAIEAQTIMDLLDWLRYTHNKFYGKNKST